MRSLIMIVLTLKFSVFLIHNITQTVNNYTTSPSFVAMNIKEQITLESKSQLFSRNCFGQRASQHIILEGFLEVWNAMKKIRKWAWRIPSANLVDQESVNYFISYVLCFNLGSCEEIFQRRNYPP